MIPSSRLIAFAALLVPLGFIPALAPEFNMFGVVLVSVLFVVTSLDLILSRKREVAYQLSAPDLVRMTVGQPAEIPLQLKGGGRKGARLTTALGLPSEFRSEQPELSFSVPVENKSYTVIWHTVPQIRGTFQVSVMVLVAHSALGLWEIRAHHSLAIEIRVYPDLMHGNGRLSSLFLQLARAGSKVRRQVGQGREFEKLRDFVPGDALDRIHWKATAKRNKPMSKEYQVERTQEVYVLVDSSRLSRIPVAVSDQSTENLFEIYIKSALVTSLVAGQQGDNFGLCTFNSRVKTFLRAKGGKNHFNACREQLYILEPEPVSPDYRELVTFLGHKLRKRALLFILTNLDDPVLAEEFTTCMELLNRRHLVVVMSVNPTFAKPLFNDEEVNGIDDLYRNLAGHLQDQRLRTLSKQLRKHGVRLYRPEAGKLTLKVIDQYMTIKERQQL
ncbi:MAG: DUF58 domain-containing protein [Desulfobulbaceae bacterium]|nr:DUF58 domain-containing protein [Desulfobulbaceae bacterium]